MWDIHYLALRTRTEENMEHVSQYVPAFSLNNLSRKSGYVPPCPTVSQNFNLVEKNKADPPRVASVALYAGGSESTGPPSVRHRNTLRLDYKSLKSFCMVTVAS